MKPIPIKVAEQIAKQYGYDQVFLYARKVGQDPNPHGEYLVTYGKDERHCEIAGRIGKFLREKIFQWGEHNV